MKKFILPYDSKTVTLKLNDNNFCWSFRIKTKHIQL